MRQDDYDQFTAMLDDVAMLLPPSQPLSPTAYAMYFRACAAMSIDDVRAALDAHVRDPMRGRFFPRPADLMAQSSDGRPGADEAWSIAMRSNDEGATVVWTNEIALAWGIAHSLVASDEIAARLAFRDAYTRLVGEARRSNEAVEWRASLGHDPTLRDQVVAEAIELGRLPAPVVDSQRRIELHSPDEAVPMPDAVRAKLEALREQLRMPKQELDDTPSLDALARAWTRDAQAATQRKVDDYLRDEYVPGL